MTFRFPVLPLFFQRRTIWFPTRLGWAILVTVPLVLAFVWCLFGEKFLAVTDRLPAEALVVDSWIGIEGIKAARAEFAQYNYRYIITAGGLTKSRWTSERWNIAEEARKLLLQMKVAPEEVIVASAPDTESQRTFASAVAVRQEMERRGLHFTAVNVLTLGAHARRSRLVFAKVLGPETQVGVVSWRPADYRSENWWNSSDRAQEVVKETAGWLYELLLDSGRTSDLPTKNTAAPDSGIVERSPGD